MDWGPGWLWRELVEERGLNKEGMLKTEAGRPATEALANSVETGRRKRRAYMPRLFGSAAHAQDER